MTLKPNYLLAFVKMFLLGFALITVVLGIVPYFQGKEVRIASILTLAVFVGALFGIFIAIIFTPQEITWNDETIKVKALFPGSGDFEWRQLEAWGYGRGVFLIKFENMQLFQIARAGFRSQDWNVFQSLFQRRFPEKKASIWIGVSPIRFRKK